MLETIAKGRPEHGRPAGKSPRAEHRGNAAPNPQVRDDLIIQRQHDQFDFQLAERAELEREYNAMRDLAVEQLKRDDETLKKYISMI